MLGFQYVVAKSRELSSVVEREISGVTNRSSSFVAAFDGGAAAASTEEKTPAEVYEASDRNEGERFLRIQQNRQLQAEQNHHRLLDSGQELETALRQARATLQAQATSEQFLAQNFHLVSHVRRELQNMHAIVLRVAEEADCVEKLLLQRCEENVARQKADLASTQQLELEKFEIQIARESEERKRKLLEMKREELSRAFVKDLQTYQMRVTPCEGGSTTALDLQEEDWKQESLDEVELVVMANSDQLEAFYESEHEDEEKQFVSNKIEKWTESRVPGDKCDAESTVNEKEIIGMAERSKDI
ncbi:uncharacterized protein CCR75_008631 [Bremia lactucae]|uniref:Uncharacterized protein n=1 Tax=Bremia lactucae TaxID=4779 RepID=A0A976ID11_BRELC|nr:hypothetical protein CCR75_008631 [Bremia lactucae]